MLNKTDFTLGLLLGCLLSAIIHLYIVGSDGPLRVRGENRGQMEKRLSQFMNDRWAWPCHYYEISYESNYSSCLPRPKKGKEEE